MRRKPIALIILDGMGINDNTEANAVAQAKTPVLDGLLAKYPQTTLAASGRAVGLMPGQMGDSNVGHLNLGAGRIVYQNLPKIFKAIEEGSFAANEVVQGLLSRGKEHGLHLMGLLSDGGVHSHIEHLFSIIDLAKGAGVTELYVHAFLDGRDVPPKSAQGYLEALEAKLAAVGLGRIATVSGRYFAMDRDRRWERTEKAFRAIVTGEGERAATALEALEQAYSRGETDEFVLPTVIGKPAVLTAEAAAFFFNFRPDRGRQLSRALFETAFDGFGRPEGFTPRHLATMTEYDASLPIPLVFAPDYLTATLGEVVAKAGLTQLRIAETEKYAHVTYFFSGMKEEAYPGEERCLVPSPKVATYDLQPEMSAPTVAAEAVKRIASDACPDLVVLNFANPDMVGHTGDLSAAIRAVEAVDTAMGQVLEAILAKGGAAIVLADHGNCEQMVDYETGTPHTNHTLNPVWCILVDDSRLGVKLNTGLLGNVAPTLLELLSLPQPPEMDQTSLLAN